VKKSITFCDYCSAQTDLFTTIHIPIDRQSDGNGMEIIQAEFDLCPSCSGSMLKAVLKDFVKDKDYNVLTAIAKFWSLKHPFRRV